MLAQAEGHVNVCAGTRNRARPFKARLNCWGS